MSDNNEKRVGVVPSLPRTILWVLLAVVVGAILWYFRQATVYILVSAVLAFVGRPLVHFLCKAHIGRFEMPRWLAATLTLILLWGVLGGIIAVVVPLVAGKIIDLSNLISGSGSSLDVVMEPLQNVQKYITDTLGLPAVQSEAILDDFVKRLLKFLNYDTVTSVLSSIIELGSSLVVAMFSISFITFFFLKEDGLFSKMVAAIFPDKYSENVYRAINKISVLLSRYFTGLLTESLIIASVIAVVLLLFGMQFENACFIAIVMGMLNVIPYAGPAIGVLVSMFIGIVSPIEGCTISYTLAVICGVIGVVKGADDFVLQPTIYSSKVSAHPLEIFIVILMAGSVGQIVGLLVAVPTYTILRVFAKEFLSEVPLVNKLTKEI
jgi:predicted PurR-regulated permease PerM